MNLKNVKHYDIQYDIGHEKLQEFARTFHLSTFIFSPGLIIQPKRAAGKAAGCFLFITQPRLILSGYHVVILPCIEESITKHYKNQQIRICLFDMYATSADLENGGVFGNDACSHHYTVLLLQDPY